MDSSPNEKVLRLLSDLQQEVEHFILKMTSVFEGRKMQLIFLINNYDMIISVLTVSLSSSLLVSSDTFMDFHFLLYIGAR